MAILYRVAEAAADTRLNIYAIHSIATMAAYADVNGHVGADESGQPMSNPDLLAEKIKAGASTVRKALVLLEKHGYVRWDRAWSQERRAPIPGSTARIQILIPSSAQRP